MYSLKEEEIPYEFSVNDVAVDSLGTLKSTLEQVKELNTEKLVEIVYQPQAVFRVRAVTRCTSTIAGHTEAVIAVAFSPDGRCCADTSVHTLHACHVRVVCVHACMCACVSLMVYISVYCIHVWHWIPAWYSEKNCLYCMYIAECTFSVCCQE